MRKLVFSPADWISLNESYSRVRAAVGSRDLALHDLTEHLRKGRLPSAARRNDAAGTFESVKLSQWQGVTLSAYSGPVKVRGFDNPDDGEIWFFVARADLDKLYPAVGVAAADSPARHKPGPKPKGDWPIMLGAWLIMIAAEEPKRLQNVAALTAEAGAFLDKKLGWAPQDERDLRRKIKDFLQFVR